MSIIAESAAQKARLAGAKASLSVGQFGSPLQTVDTQPEAFNNYTLNGSTTIAANYANSWYIQQRKSALENGTVTGWREAFWPEVRDRIVTPKDRKNARAFVLKGLTRQHHESFEHLFDANLRRHIKYSIADLFRYALNMPCRDEHHTFCSRYVLHCCHAILPDNLMPLVRLPTHDWADPHELLISPRLADSWF